MEVEKVVAGQAQPGEDEEVEYLEAQLVQVQQEVRSEVVEEEPPVLMQEVVVGEQDVTDYFVQMRSGQLGQL